MRHTLHRKIKIYIKDFSSKCDLIRRKLMENFIFCANSIKGVKIQKKGRQSMYRQHLYKLNMLQYGMVLCLLIYLKMLAQFWQ